MWTCVEDRLNGVKYGRFVRKLVFGDIFINKTALISQNPIPASSHKHLNVSERFFYSIEYTRVQTGDKVSYYGEDDKVFESIFICSSETDIFSPKTILTNLLNQEEDLAYFCKQYNLKSGSFCRFGSIINIATRFSVLVWL